MTQRPPDLTLPSRAIMGLLNATSAWSRPWRLALAFVAMCVPVAVDALTRPAVNIGFVYVLAVAIAAWFAGEARAIAMSLLAVVAGGWAKHAQIEAAHLPLSLLGEFWNAFARFLSQVVVAFAVHGMRSALALERWRASNDGLTGVLNKSAFEREAAAAIGKARAKGQAIVLAYLDLDGFKGVNDRYGHGAGDRVLQAFAGAAANTVRVNDLFARIGGDEFVALLVVPTCEQGDQVAEMLHARLTEVLSRTGFPVTCSMGALVAQADELDLESGALEVADMLMYEVKRSGKNALRIARAVALVGQTLRNAYPPEADSQLSDLLQEIDRADADRRGAAERRAA